MLKPAGYRVLIKADPVEEKSKGGIITVTPDNEKMEKAGNVKGVVKDIGPLAFKAFAPNHTGEPWCTAGDWVVYAKYAGKTIIDPYSDEEYIICNDEDVVAVITEEE